MSRLHKSVEVSPGEIYHVETTRQAKRRHQRSGAAQFKPTIGQLNAADIWNKQQEKIKKDREREDKKRKDKQRQEVKDERQKAIQEELLRKGKISIEDTWGKVNASQNRLHKFFGVAQTLTRPVQAAGEHECGPDKRLQVQADPGTSGREEKCSVQPTSSQVDDLEKIFTDSSPPQSSQANIASAHRSFNNEAGAIIPDNHIGDKNFLGVAQKRRRMSTSRDQMPPPRRPRPSSSTPTQPQSIVQPVSSTPDSQGRLEMPIRSPLGELTESQVNVRASQTIDAINKTRMDDTSYPVATQVVRDALSGLSSQDLVDDFTDDDKENEAPLKPACSDKLRSDLHLCETSPLQETKNTAHVDTLSTTHWLDAGLDESDNDEHDEFDEFDDEGIDDESLLTLAATQRLKHDLFMRSKHDGKTEFKSLAPRHSLSPQALHKRQPSGSGTRVGDSFTTDGLNDDDLVENLEAFENGVQDISGTGGQYSTMNLSDKAIAQLSNKKKRRTLPWLKNPLLQSFGRGGFDADADIAIYYGDLTPSPPSPLEVD